MPVVSLDVDRPFVEERLVQTVELFLNRLLPALDLDNSLLRIVLQISPCVKDAILDEAHETRGRLQSRELVDEHLFEFGLADVGRAASTAAVVVRVVVAAPFRPARRQRLAARL